MLLNKIFWFNTTPVLEKPSTGIVILTGEQPSLSNLLIQTEQPEAPAPIPPAEEQPEPALLGRWESTRKLVWIVLGAMPVLAVAAGLRMWDFSRQSAYMDEASYIVTGRSLLELGNDSLNGMTWIFGSYLYPLMVGWLDQWGGLEAARGLSFVAGLVTVLATIFITVGLFKAMPHSREQARADFAISSKPVMAAYLAGLVVAVMPTAIALSKFATYDMLAAALFACGVAAFVWARRELALSKREHVRRTLGIGILFGLAALFFFGAFLAKYIVALYFPALCLLLLLNRRELKSGLVSFVVPLSVACAGYYFFFATELAGLLKFAANYRDLKSPDLWQTYGWERLDLLLLMLVAYWGLRQSLRDRRTGAALLLWSGAIMLLAFQFITRADHDYWKHSIYLIVMLAPLAGWLWADWSWWDEPGTSGRPNLLARWWGSLKRLGRPEIQPDLAALELNVAGTPATERPGSYSLMAVMAALIVAVGMVWAQPAAARLVSHWTSLAPALPEVQRLVREGDSVLVDDSALLYYLYGKGQVTTPFYFAYNGQQGLPAYRQAVADQRFQVVILNGGQTTQGQQMWKEVRPALLSSPAYSLEYTQPLDPFHTVEIFRRLTSEEQANGLRKTLPPPAPSATTPAATSSKIPSKAESDSAPVTLATTTTPAASTEAPLTVRRPTTPTVTANPAPAKQPEYPAKASFNFNAGDEGWGTLNADGKLEPGMGVISTPDYKLGGVNSLRFQPNPINKYYTVGVGYSAMFRQITMQVYIPADKAEGEVRVGLYYFDLGWKWYDNGFQTRVVPGQWTTLTLEIPAAAVMQQFGLKVLGYSGAVYLNGIVVE